MAPLLATGVAILAVLLAVVLVQLRRRARAIRVLQDAASALPWPAEEISTQLVDRVAAAIPGPPAILREAPGGPGELSVRYDDDTWLVVPRSTGRRGLTEEQRRTVGALVAMASTAAAGARREEQLRRQAATDHLTGLWTYPHFLHLFGAASTGRAPGEQIAVLFLDLDGFREVNEAFGHVDADQVLHTLGARLRERLDDETLCARYGGDEFVMVRRRVRSSAELQDVCAEIAGIIAEPVPVAGRLLQVGVTIGHALSETVGDDPVALVRAADDDLRRRKATLGRSRPG